MPSRPPPSRYRVIERGRRLVVIDTWAGARARPGIGDYEADAGDLGAAPVADAPVPPLADAMPGTWRDASASALVSPDPETARADPIRDWRAEPPPSAPTPTSEAMAPPELLRGIAAAICGDARDVEGRRLFRTAAFYDARGPRRIALDADGERELGLTVLVASAITVGGLVFALSLGWPGIVAAMIAAALVRQVRLVATPWLDRLATRTR